MKVSRDGSIVNSGSDCGDEADVRFLDNSTVMIKIDKSESFMTYSSIDGDLHICSWKQSMSQHFKI